MAGLSGQTVNTTARQVGKSVPVNARFGGVGSLFGRLVQPAIDVGSRLSQGENPVNAIVSAAGGELGAMGAGAAAARLAPGNPLIKGIAGMVGYAAASPATNAGINWLSKNATLSDRGALNGPYSHVIGSIPPKNKTGEWYRDQELQFSAAARAAGGPSAGGGIGGGNMASFVPNPQSSPAAERAYRQQLSSTAQQVAQDPQLDDFAKQRALDVASKDYSKSEDMGMRIWAQKYGPGSKNDLASKVKPGQAGYDVIQSVINKQTTPTPTFNPYGASNLPDLWKYAGSMQGTIISSLEGVPALNDSSFKDYNPNTWKESYNLTNAFPSVTTQQTLSLPVGTYPIPNMSAYGGGIYPGEPLKIPFQTR